MIVFRHISALRPRADVHSRPALLSKCCLTPSLLLAEVFAKPLSGSADLYWVNGYVNLRFCMVQL